jgi:uncharacterized membrane protein YeaQ/YmgE (transglycosylase-associated protein family)
MHNSAFLPLNSLIAYWAHCGCPLIIKCPARLSNSFAAAIKTWQTKIFLFDFRCSLFMLFRHVSNATSEYGSLFMLGLLGVLIIGLIVGAIAKLIVPGKEPGGCLVTSAIGVAGSFVAFYLGTLLGWTSGNPDSLRPVGFIPSLIGAVILLLVYHWIRRRFGR